MRTVTALFIAMAIAAVSAAPVPTRRTEASVQERTLGSALSLSDDVRKQPVMTAIVDASHLEELELNPRAPVHGFDLFPDLKLAGEERVALPAQLTLDKVADGAGISNTPIGQLPRLAVHAPVREEARIGAHQLPAGLKAAAPNLDLTLRPPGTPVEAHTTPPAFTLPRDDITAPGQSAPQRITLTDKDGTVSSVPAPKSIRWSMSKLVDRGRQLPDADSSGETKLQDEVDNWIFDEAKRKYHTAISERTRARKRARRLKEVDPQWQNVNTLLQRWEDKLQTARRQFYEARLTFSKAQQEFRKTESDRLKAYRSRTKGKRANS